MSTLPFIITPNSIIVKTKNGPKTIQKDEDNYNALYDAIKNQEWIKVERLANKIEEVKYFAQQTNGLIEVRGNAVYYDQEELHGYLINKILQFAAENLPIEPLVNFTEKLMSNPSKRCVDSLYEFLEYKNMPIDPDGDFYAYKAVRCDFTDKRTGTFDNSIGKIVSVPRRSVDDNPDVECSYGLHAGSIQYVKGFGRGDDKYIIVKINPANVVSVPENDKSKLRCCEYQVVEEYTDILSDTTYHSDNIPDYSWEDEYDSYEDYVSDYENNNTWEEYDFPEEDEYDELVNDFWDGIQSENEEEDDKYYEFLKAQEEQFKKEEEEYITSGYVYVPEYISTTEYKITSTDNNINISPREEIISKLEELDIPYTRKTNTEKLRKKLIKYLETEEV